MQYRTILRSALLLSLTPLLGAAPAPPPAELVAAAEKGYLGVSITEAEGAVRVVEIYPESAAEAAGLRPGDLLLAVDGHSVGDLTALKEALGGHEPGDSAVVRLRRGEEQLELPVVLGKRPGPDFAREERAPRARLERQQGGEPNLWVDKQERHAPRVHVERTEGEPRIRIQGLEGLEALEALEGLEGLEALQALEGLEALEGMHPRIHIEHTDGEQHRTRSEGPHGLHREHGSEHDGGEPRVWVWRSGDDGALEIEVEADGLPRGLEHEDGEWRARLDEHMGELHEHLQQGWGELSEKLHEHHADDAHGKARQHWSHAMRDLERLREDQEDQLKDLRWRMRSLHVPRAEAPRDGSPRWFEGRGRAFDVARPQVYRFGGGDEVQELRETVTELRDELRGLREELRALRDELRGR